MIYLHKMPGQHNAAVRGNWVWMQLWRWLADSTVYLVLFPVGQWHLPLGSAAS